MGESSAWAIRALNSLAADAEVRLDQLADLFARCQDGNHGLARGGTDLVQGVEVEGVARGDDQRAVPLFDGGKRILDESAWQGTP